jgi:HNH endonuclease
MLTDDEFRRFMAKVSICAKTACWLWVASKDSKGYGQFGIVRDGKKFNRRAHRLSFEQHRGPIQDGMELHHNCEVKHCVNPGHLKPVTHAQNMSTGKWDIPVMPRCAEYQLSKTQCPKGHPLSGENLYIYPDGRRQCETCRQAARVDYASRVPRKKWSEQTDEQKQRHADRRRQWRNEQRAKGIRPS